MSLEKGHLAGAVGRRPRPILAIRGQPMFVVGESASEKGAVAVNTAHVSHIEARKSYVRFHLLDGTKIDLLLDFNAVVTNIVRATKPPSPPDE